MTFTEACGVNSGRSKTKKIESGHCYIQSAPRKKKYCLILRRAPKIKKITCSLGR